MTNTFNDLQLRQIDERLQPLRHFAQSPPPRSGWIRAIRQALGMTQPQLAARLGMTRQALNDLEKAEVAGKITLASIRRIANALGCELSYAIVPAANSLAEIRAQRARQIADEQLRIVSHSMKLEAQGATESELERQRERITDEMLRGSSRKLWR